MTEKEIDRMLKVMEDEYLREEREKKEIEIQLRDMSQEDKDRYGLC